MQKNEFVHFNFLIIFQINLPNSADQRKEIDFEYFCGHLFL